MGTPMPISRPLVAGSSPRRSSPGPSRPSLGTQHPNSSPSRPRLRPCLALSGPSRLIPGSRQPCLGPWLLSLGPLRPGLGLSHPCPSHLCLRPNPSMLGPDVGDQGLALMDSGVGNKVSGPTLMDLGLGIGGPSPRRRVQGFGLDGQGHAYHYRSLRLGLDWPNPGCRGPGPDLCRLRLGRQEAAHGHRVLSTISVDLRPVPMLMPGSQASRLETSTPVPNFLVIHPQITRA